MSTFKFDVMLDGRFVTTMSMPMPLKAIKGFCEGVAIINEKYLQKAAKAYAVKKRPSLKNKDIEVFAV